MTTTSTTDPSAAADRSGTRPRLRLRVATGTVLAAATIGVVAIENDWADRRNALTAEQKMHAAGLAWISRWADAHNLYGPSPASLTALGSSAPSSLRPIGGAGTDPAHTKPGVDEADERPLPDHKLLAARARYRAAGQFQDIDIVFTAPAAPVYGLTSARFVGVSTDPHGIETVIAMLPEAGLRVFRSVDIERAGIDPQTIGDVTTLAPDDIVSWLAHRPFLRASRIRDDLQVGDLNGRGFSYQVGELSAQARACGPPPTRRCAATIWTSNTTLHMAAGDKGWVLEIDVGGQPVLAVVRDEPVTAQLLDSLRFEVAPVPEAARGATRLPYLAPALNPGVDYYVDRVGRSAGLVLTAPEEPTAASQRDDVAWFGGPSQAPAPRHYYLTALDAATVVANPDPALNPYVLVRPGGIVRWELDHFLRHTQPLPDDPIGWLTEQPHVVVVESAHNTLIGGHRARVTDVKAARRFDTITCPDGIGNCVMPFAHRTDAFPIVISSEYVTRVINLTVGEDHILIAADLGTPGETLLASLHANRDPETSTPATRQGPSCCSYERTGSTAAGVGAGS